MPHTRHAISTLTPMPIILCAQQITTTMAAERFLDASADISLQRSIFLLISILNISRNDISRYILLLGTGHYSRRAPAAI